MTGPDYADDVAGDPDGVLEAEDRTIAGMADSIRLSAECIGDALMTRVAKLPGTKIEVDADGTHHIEAPEHLRDSVSAVLDMRLEILGIAEELFDELQKLETAMSAQEATRDGAVVS